jgi:hypothetical protein
VAEGKAMNGQAFAICQTLRRPSSQPISGAANAKFQM